MRLQALFMFPCWSRADLLLVSLIMRTSGRTVRLRPGVYSKCDNTVARAPREGEAADIAQGVQDANLTVKIHINIDPELGLRGSGLDDKPRLVLRFINSKGIYCRQS